MSGLAPTERESEPVRAFALLDATWVNLVTARKPEDDCAPAEEVDYPYGRPLEDKPPDTPGHRLKRGLARALRALADRL